MTPRVTAEETSGDILTDFSEVANFDMSEYPVVADDYSLHVIQIAESSNDRLFVYVYQPSGETKGIRARDIAVSMTIGEDAGWFYSLLEYVGHSGTIYKYLARGITVSDEDVRYYNISSVSRLWDKDIDDPSGTDNEINTVAYSVGQEWTVITVDGHVTYDMQEVDVVELKDLYANSIRYITGKDLFNFTSACDVFFVAFSADRRIDELMEADVDFYYYPYTCQMDKHYNIKDGTYFGATGKKTHEVAYLNGEESTDYAGYSWKWIQSSEDFLKEENANISSAVKEIVKKQQWVLRYAAMGLKMDPTGWGVNVGYLCQGYTTESVSILRLKFVTDGEVYNLGVVSDKVTGPISPTRPDKSLSLWDRFLRWVKNVMAMLFGVNPSDIPDWLAVMFVFAFVFLFVIVFRLLMPFMPGILSALGKGVVAIGKGLWWLICAPFRGIKALIDKRKGGA